MPTSIVYRDEARSDQHEVRQRCMAVCPPYQCEELFSRHGALGGVCGRESYARALADDIRW